MNKSTEIGNLAKALSAVQGKLQPAQKDAANPFFKSKYSTLGSVWDCCRALLTDNGLSVAQVNQIATDGVVIETVLMHESGEWISGEMFLPLAKHDAQAVGSATSYGRRYALASMVGIVSDDDDGNSASQPKHQTKPAPGKAPEKPLSERIAGVSKAIGELGGKIEARAGNETEQAYFESLVEQWQTLQGRR